MTTTLNEHSPVAEPLGHSNLATYIAFGDIGLQLLIVVLIVAASSVGIVDIPLAKSHGTKSDPSALAVRVAIDPRGFVQVDEQPVGHLTHRSSEVVASLQERVAIRGSAAKKICIFPAPQTSWQHIVDLRDTAAAVTDQIEIIAMAKDIQE